MAQVLTLALSKIYSKRLSKVEEDWIGNLIPSKIRNYTNRNPLKKASKKSCHELTGQLFEKIVWKIKTPTYRVQSW